MLKLTVAIKNYYKLKVKTQFTRNLIENVLHVHIMKCIQVSIKG